MLAVGAEDGGDDDVGGAEEVGDCDVVGADDVGVDCEGCAVGAAGDDGEGAVLLGEFGALGLPALGDGLGVGAWLDGTADGDVVGLEGMCDGWDGLLPLPNA